MADMLLKMLDELPIDPAITMIDPLSTSWVIIQISLSAITPGRPGKDAVTIAMAELIKSEPALRANAKLLAIAEEVVGTDNICKTPYTIARALEQTLELMMKAKA